MKKLSYLFMFFAIVFSCKSNEDMSPNANGFIYDTAGGPWYLKEIEVATVDNKTKWEAAPANLADTLIFRNDGVILRPDGKPMCCAPKSLIINGNLMDIVPATAITPNPLCALINCVYCPVWEMTQNNNELIIKACNNARRRYVR